MFHPSSLCVISSLGIMTLIAFGCSGGAAPAPKATSDAKPATGHDHPTEGPHHGDLVELGNEEYHAEIVHGKDAEVVIYILDDKAKSPVAIAAQEITINLTHDGQAEQFKLAASPEGSDPEGRSSRFLLKDEELSRDLDEKDVAAKLVVSIEGKSYTGKIEHHHEGGGEHKH